MEVTNKIRIDRVIRFPGPLAKGFSVHYLIGTFAATPAGDAKTGDLSMFATGQMSFTMLDDRDVVRVGGEDKQDFLQNIITNDVSRVSDATAIWAALLTPQGKYLHDFFVIAMDDALMLDCEGGRGGDLVERLGRYKLRSKVEISDVSADWAVAALMGTEADADALVGFEGRGGPFAGGICYVDPRYGAMGSRLLFPRGEAAQLLESGFEQAEPGIFDHTRLCMGLPDGSRDLALEKALPMENGFDPLNGLDWDKGCYVGQEMTARMRYRANIRRQLLPVSIDGPAPQSGATIFLGDRDAGEMRSSASDIGLALLRIDALEALQGSELALTAGSSTLTPMRPPWLDQAADGKAEDDGGDNG
ncbi:MAG: folate-binding protein [Alphaproteobacteria bacterium]|nr:folate-binding protein [Alphaproteobacteria bacterium]